MGAELRVYRRRIRSVKSTQKITRAMELIAASRIARAQSRLRDARPYAAQITRAAQNVALQSGVDHPMLRPPAEDSGVALLVVTSDRGLAGAYSSSVLRLAEQLAEQAGSGGRPVRLYVTGRKGVGYFRFRERPVEGSWVGFSEQPTYEHAKDIAATLLDDFLSGRVGEVQVAFTDFFSVLTQRPVTSRLLPLGPDGVTTVPAPGSTPPGYATVTAQDGGQQVEGDRLAATPGGGPAPVVTGPDGRVDTMAAPEGAQPQYSFVPSPAAVLDALLPRYLETRVFVALLEAGASELASRRRAMNAATKNADELVKVLTRAANRARQAEITQELMEIIGGAEALTSRGSE